MDASNGSNESRGVVVRPDCTQLIVAEHRNENNAEQAFGGNCYVGKLTKKAKKAKFKMALQPDGELNHAKGAEKLETVYVYTARKPV